MEKKDKLALIISFISLGVAMMSCAIAITSWIQSREATKANIVFHDMEIDVRPIPSNIKKDTAYIRTTFIFKNTGNESAAITGGQICILDLNGKLIKRFISDVLEFQVTKDALYHFSIFLDAPMQGLSPDEIQAAVFF